MTRTPILAPPRKTVLRERSFVFYLCARVSTSMAFQIQAVAVGWQVYTLTGDVFDLGLVGLFEFLPMLVLALIVGHVADRYDRRLVIRIAQIVQGLAALVLAVGSYQGWIDKALILTVITVFAAARSFEGPTMGALAPTLVQQSFIARGMAWSTSANQTANILGPALGGFLYAVGPTAVYFVCATLLLLASILMVFVRKAETARLRSPPTLASLFAGIAFIKSRPIILGALSLDLFAVLLGGAVALLPVYARDILFVGPVGLGILRSGPAAGALTFSVLLAHFPLRRRVGLTMFGAVIAFGLGTIVFAVSTSFLLSLACLFILGASDVISVVVRQSLVQLETPDEMRGRVSAVNSMFIGTSNQLGAFESGMTAALFGTVPAVIIGGLGTVAIALLWMRLFPELARKNSFENQI